MAPPVIVESHSGNHQDRYSTKSKDKDHQIKDVHEKLLKAHSSKEQHIPETLFSRVEHTLSGITESISQGAAVLKENVFHLADKGSESAVEDVKRGVNHAAYEVKHHTAEAATHTQPEEVGILQRTFSAIGSALHITSADVHNAADRAEDKVNEAASKVQSKIHDTAESTRRSLRSEKHKLNPDDSKAKSKLNAVERNISSAESNISNKADHAKRAAKEGIRSIKQKAHEQESVHASSAEETGILQRIASALHLNSQSADSVEHKVDKAASEVKSYVHDKAEGAKHALESAKYPGYGERKIADAESKLQNEAEHARKAVNRGIHSIKSKAHHEENADSGVLHNLAASISSALHLSSDQQETAHNKVNSVAAQIKEKVHDTAEYAKQELHSSTSAAKLNRAERKVSSAESNLHHKVEKARQSVNESLHSLKNKASDFQNYEHDNENEGIFHQIASAISNAVSSGSESVKSAAERAESAVNSTASKIKDKIDDTVDYASQEIHSGKKNYSDYNMKSLQQRISDAESNLHHKVEKYRKAAHEGIDSAQSDTGFLHNVGESVSRVWKSASHESQEIAENLKDKVQEMTSYVSDKAHDAKEYGYPKSHIRDPSILQRVQDAVSRTAHYGQESSVRAYESAQRAQKRTTDFVNDVIESAKHLHPHGYATQSAMESACAKARYKTGDYVGAAEKEAASLWHGAEESISSAFHSDNKGYCEQAKDAIVNAGEYVSEKASNAAHSIAESVGRRPSTLSAQATAEAASARMRYKAGDLIGAVEDEAASVYHSAYDKISGAIKSASQSGKEDSLVHRAAEYVASTVPVFSHGPGKECFRTPHEKKEQENEDVHFESAWIP